MQIAVRAKLLLVALIALAAAGGSHPAATTAQHASPPRPDAPRHPTTDATSQLSADGSTTPSRPAAATGSSTYDVNGDGQVAPLDALCVLRDVAGLPATSACPDPYVHQHADVVGNGSISPLDALCVLRFVAGLATTPACPAPINTPPDPKTFAPPPTGEITSFCKSTQFLYSGATPIQTGVTAGTLQCQRASVLRGRVLSRANLPLPGVTINVLGHPEFGQTISRLDGTFDLAVNGGGQLTVNYARPGLLPAQRQVQAPLQDYAAMPDAILLPADAQVTAVDLTAATPIQVAQGSPVTDTRGTRQATLFVPQATQATMTLANGTTQPLTSLHIRATEYTVGPMGPTAMPADLPPTSAYTYAFEVNADEAVAAGATGVTFNRPLPFYVENFLGFPVGAGVPLGAYDRGLGQWVASDSGLVVKLLSVAGGVASLDIDGSGTAATAAALAAAGISDAERTQLATLYSAGTSLWRVALAHFSAWDCNMGPWPPPDAGGPNPSGGPGGGGGGPGPGCPPKPGSIIECPSQILGEALDLAGTAAGLHYESDRESGRQDASTLTIPVSGATVPASLKRIELEVHVAGRVFPQHFPAAANQVAGFTWDGKDVYGRTPQGSQRVRVRIGFVYNTSYQETPRFGSNGSGGPISANSTAMEITFWLDQDTTVGRWDAMRGVGLGGWTLSVHHSYDPNSRTLYLGNGQTRNVDSLPHSITTVAGNGAQGFSGDGGPAGQASLNYPFRVAPGPDGSLYIADALNNRVRRVGPDGVISTVAGTGGQGFSGDGGPAGQASLNSPYGVAVGPDGSLFIADTNNSSIRRVGLDGVISTVAGTGAPGYNGDGGPARLASVSSPSGVAVGTDGSLFVADTQHSRIRRVGLNGIISTVAGTGGPGIGCDGGPALQAVLGGPWGIAVGPDGSLFIADANNSCIRRVGVDGIISTVAGTGVEGFGGDGGLAGQALLTIPTGVAVGPDGSLFIADRNNFRIRKVAPALPRFAFGELFVAAEDGSELYHFNSDGRHLSTIDALNGVLRWQFGYDTAGRLISATDVAGNVTTIQRDAGGNPSAIVAPGGQRTALTLDANGYLASVTDPAGDMVQLSAGAGGLLTRLTDARGGVHSMVYDSLGLLTSDTSPTGGITTLARTVSATGYTVTLTTPAGRVTTYLIESRPGGVQHELRTDPTGARTDVLVRADGSQSATYPDGTTRTVILGPDPRFGMQAPLVSASVLTEPGGGGTRTLTHQRTATLATPGDPLSLQTLTDTVALNGSSFTTTYTAATRTLSRITPGGRSSTAVLDAQGRVVSLTPAGGVTPIVWSFDGLGRQTQVAQGSQSLSYAYDARNRTTSGTDAAGNKTQYGYDVADRLTTLTLPGGQSEHFAYDAAGNRTQLTMPSGAAHALSYTLLDQDAGYTPPGNAAYGHSYNADRSLAGATLPGGRAEAYGYDSGGRPTGVAFPEGTDAFVYAAGDPTDRVSGISRTPVGGGAVQALALSYLGNLVTGLTVSGTAQGQYSYSYDSNLFLSGQTLVSGADTVQTALARDADGLLTNYGPFTLARNGPGGAVSQIGDGTQSLSLSYNALGEIVGRTNSVTGQQIYQDQLTEDSTSHITRKVETVAGTSHTVDYGYDANGQLQQVSRDGVVVERYSYDANGNRSSRQLGVNAAETATYDGQDRLTGQGSVSYQINADGFLALRGTDTFQYSTRGELLQATAGGQTVSYAYDGIGRRVSRTDAAGTTQYLYSNAGDPFLATAVRSAAGQLTSLYYDDHGLLFALERGGARYAVATDQVGTPRVVSDATGVVVKALDYDSFGNLSSDSNAGFDLPLGFAGGLADRATGLVRFGFRDYDPVSGRSTARDPALYGGGQANLYVYAGNNPLNQRDPTGLFCIGGAIYDGFGGGGQFCVNGDGVSVCGELGLGLGESLDVQPLGDLAKTGITEGVELQAGVPGLNVTVGLELDICTGELKKIGKGEAGPATFDFLDPVSGGSNKNLFASAKPANRLPNKAGIGFEGKVYAKGCIQGKW